MSHAHSWSYKASVALARYQKGRIVPITDEALASAQAAADMKGTALAKAQQQVEYLAALLPQAKHISMEELPMSFFLYRSGRNKEGRNSNIRESRKVYVFPAFLFSCFRKYVLSIFFQTSPLQGAALPCRVELLFHLDKSLLVVLILGKKIVEKLEIKHGQKR